MGHEHLEYVDRALLVIAEARERAERAARAIRREDPASSIAAALEEADRKLLTVHNELTWAVYFPQSSEQQLELASGA